MTANLSASANVGAVEISVFLVNFLFGMVTIQTYNYYRRYPDDSPHLKFLVAVVWLGELAHSVAVSCTVFIFSIASLGRMGDFMRIPAPLGVSVILSGALSVAVQSFFAHRVYVLSKKIFIPLCCWVLSLFRFAGSLAVTIGTFAPVAMDVYVVKWRWLVIVTLLVGACVDVIVAVSQWYYLKRERALVFERTARTLSKLMSWSIRTGLLTSVVAVATLICFLTMSENFIWLALYMFIAELYSNALLVSLNARIVDPAPPISQRISIHQNKGDLRFADRLAIGMTTVTHTNVDTPVQVNESYIDDLYLRSKQDIEPGDVVEV